MVQRWYQETSKTWSDVLNESSDQSPDKIFVKFKESAITFREFRTAVDDFAKGLLELGVNRGDNVALWMGNCLEWLYAQFAIYKLGCVMIPVYTRWRILEVEYALKQSDATTLIMEENFLGKIDAVDILTQIIPEVKNSGTKQLSNDKFPNLRRIILKGDRSLKGAYSYNEVANLGKKSGLDQKLETIRDEVDPFDAMNIMYTSGTTGFPKGGISMHRNNMATAYLWAGERMNITEQDVLLNNFPLYSNFACFVVYFAVLFRASMVLTETFDPEETLRLVEEEKITALFGSPPMFAMLLDHPDFRKRNMASLRTGAIGGSPVSPSLFAKIVDQMGIKDLISGYGLSEAGAASNTTLPNDPIEVRATTVGVPLPNFKVKVVDPQTGQTLPPGQQGEVWLHDTYTGSGVGKGYYNMPDKTAEVFRADGWFRSGDLGIMDEKQYLKITGRLKDMALVGGFNVYPVEIENFLSTHPKIQQAFVVGVPDKRLDEVIMAYIVMKKGQELTESEVIDFCKQNIANYKVPKYVKFIDISEIPFSGHEKVQKFKLRDKAIKELGMES